jgi:hypothetical protein
MNETRRPTGELDQLISRAQANLGAALPARAESTRPPDREPIRPVAWTEWVEWIQWVEWVQR